MDRDPSVVLPYTKERGLTFPSLLDPAGEVYPRFGVRYTPTNFLINRKGEVVGRSIGYRDWNSPEGMKFLKALVENGTAPKNLAKK